MTVWIMVYQLGLTVVTNWDRRHLIEATGVGLLEGLILHHGGW